MACYLDESSQALTATLRPGRAGADTVADHSAVLYLALEQLPVPARCMETMAAPPPAASPDFVDGADDPSDPAHRAY